MSVCGTGATRLPRSFSRQYGLTALALGLRRGLAIPPHPWCTRICQSARATGLDAYGQQDAAASPLGPSLGVNDVWRDGTINPLSIAYALPESLGLGPPHPERIALAQEPLGFRCVGFAPTIRYSCRHSHFPAVQPSLRSTFFQRGTLPYHVVDSPRSHNIRSFGGVLSPVTLSAPRHSTSELLRTLSRVAASKPTSWLSGQHDRLSHYRTHLGTLAAGLGCFPLDGGS